MGSRGCIAMACAVVASAPSVAALADPATGAQLFDEGRELIRQGRIDEACAKFEESWKLEHAIGTELNLADCDERAGKLVEARRLFLESVADAERQSDATRADYALHRAAAIEARLATVEVTNADRVPAGTTIEIAGHVVKASPAIAERVDPGPVTIRVTTADGRQVVADRVVAVGGEVTHYRLPALAAAEITAEPRAARRRSWLYASGGLLAGAAAAAIAGYFVGASADDARAHVTDGTSCTLSDIGYICPNAMQASTVQAHLDSADTLYTTSTVLWVGGGVLAAAAVAVFVYAPRDRLVVTPTVSGKTASLMFSYAISF